MAQPGFKNKVLRFLFYADIPEEEYLKVYDAMMKTNLKTLHLLSTMAVVFFSICFGFSRFVPNMYTKQFAYSVGMGFSFGILLLSSLFRKNNRLVELWMYLFTSTLLVCGLLISLFQAPNQLTITLVPLLVVIPLFYENKPWKILVNILSADVVYLILAPILKPADILILDTVDVIMFSIIGVIIGNYTTKTKIMHHIYAYKLQQNALTDELTGCSNRRAYEDILHAIRATEIEPGTGVIMIDVNGLKKVNDTLGHDAGDEMIAGVAHVLMNSCGNHGQCFRIGGDEFTVIVHQTRAKIDEQLSAIKDELAQFQGKYIEGIAIAVGSVTCDELPGASIDELIRHADKAMYKNKSAWYRMSGIERRLH